tara:strand:- start:4679 stop:5449 length:771 start_codon:yes stop_codon:yes gene_type:complete
MRVTDFSKPITAKTLNENLAQKFGQRINLETFTLEQLQDARNKIRTRIASVEANENFNETSSEDYTKNKLFLDVLNAEIAEREDVAVADEKTIKEGAEENAALVMAAKDMVDRVTGWMEDTAEMQTESMLELGDKIRDEVGSEQSEAFIGAVKPALESLFASLESTRDSLTGGVAVLTGEGAPETMGAEDPAAEDPAMEPTVDQEAEAGVEEPAGDEFDAAGAAAGGEAEAGREQRESIEKSRKLGQLLVGSKKKS